MRSQVTGTEIHNSLIGEKTKIKSMSATLAAGLTLTNAFPHLIFLDPDGTNRTLVLPAVERGLWFTIVHSGAAAATMTVNNPGATLIGTVAKGDVGHFWSDGTSWFGDTVGETTNLAVSGTFAVSGAATFLGDVKFGDTTTDKVAFFGNTLASQAALVAAITTTAAIATFGWGFATSQQAQVTVAAVNAILASEKTFGFMATV